jgi:hypothetical protein
MEQLVSYRTYFHEILYLIIFKKSVKEIQVSLKSDKNYGYLHKDLCTFMRVYCRIRLRMRNISDKSCMENQDTFHGYAAYVIIWKNMVQPDRPQM